MARPVEIEIKLEVGSPEEAREMMRRLGAALVRPRHFEDNQLFDYPEGVLRAKGNVLRLRETPGQAILTFKGPYQIEGGLKSREEIEAGSADPAALRTILERLSLRPTFRYQKYREVYGWEGQEIVIDETPIGVYLEIEGDAVGIAAAASALGFSPASYVTDSYAALFRAAGGTGDMVFP